jgi:thiol-disulfide isomerase/thioredoxin
VIAVTTQRITKRRGEKMKKKTQVTEDIESTLKVKPKLYALFYASWCPHSQRFLPIFKEYAKSNPDECIAVMIDFKENLCEEYGIDYYPTVLMLKNGNVEKRLDVEPGGDLTKDQLAELTSAP